MASPAHSSRPFLTKPVILVMGCTVFAASAQIMMKFGAGRTMPPLDLSHPETIVALVLALLTNWPLIIGYCLHAGNALLLILALRDGELSVLYPIISLTYVWVSLLSMYFFHEGTNVWKAAGILLVISGVALLGRASRSV